MIARAAPPLTIPGYLAITGVDVLTPEGWCEDTTLILNDGHIRAIGADVPADARERDGSGLLALPGIIDLHGDAIERCLAPRQGVFVPDALAFSEHDQAVVAAGITTTFISLTDGIEAGIRNRGTIRRLLPVIEADDQLARHRLHVRHETCAPDDLEELIGWIDAGRLSLLSIADHVPHADQPLKLKRFAESILRRDGGDHSAILALAEAAAARRAEGRQADRILAAAARARSLPLASHDDESPEAVAASLVMGASICEFPTTLAAAQAARAGGAMVLAGAPNLVRGSSHLGLLSAAAGIAAGAVDGLCSDYHPASLFYAPFIAVESGLLTLAEAWRLVSAAPAAAVGIGHRCGALAPGMDADVLLVRPGRGLHARLISVFVAGREVAHYGC